VEFATASTSRNGNTFEVVVRCKSPKKTGSLDRYNTRRDGKEHPRGASPDPFFLTLSALQTYRGDTIIW